MRSTLSVILLGALAATAAAAGPPRPSPRSLALASGWYEHFLGRPADSDTLVWAQRIDQGTPPDNILASIVGSPEYYSRAGGTPTAFVRQLVVDLTGRPPSRDELFRWSRRLVETGDPVADQLARTDVAHDLVLRYPPGNQAAPLPPPDYDRDRERYDRDRDRDRDRRDWDRDDDYDYRRPYYPPARRDYDRPR